MNVWIVRSPTLAALWSGAGRVEGEHDPSLRIHRALLTIQSLSTSFLIWRDRRECVVGAMAGSIDGIAVVGQSQAIGMGASGDGHDQLVRAARGGDRFAFGQLYERYVKMVHGILLARIPYGDVADRVHDVFLTAMTQIHALRDDRAFGGWLARIARNQAHDHHRRSRETAELPRDLAARERPDTDGRAVLAIIRSLPDAYRETLVLRLVEGMNGDEIAERTGLTSASVRVNLHRGMSMLRDKLGKETRA